MKLSVVLLTVLSSMTVPRPARATRPIDTRTLGGPPDDPPGNPPDNPGYPFDISPQEMGEFKSQKAIKGNANIELQEEQSDGSFQVDGIIVTQSACMPVNAFVEEGATYSSGGINQGDAPPTPDLCSVTQGETSVTVARSRDTGKVEYALAYDKVNKIRSNVVSFKKNKNVLATIKDSDFDANALKKYDLADAMEDQDDRRRRRQRRRALGVPPKSVLLDEQEEGEEEEDHDAITVTGDRSLQTACGPGTKRQIRVAIAYDRSFCDAVGGDAAAVTRINSIVMAANDYYDQTGLCKLVAIAHLDSGCDGSDTFSGAVDRTTLCGSTWWWQSDVLEDFRSLWQSTSSLASIQRSAAHLFFGQGGYRISASGGSIGCAYLDALCSSTIGYGVNYMTFQGTATPVILQGLLFTHELGHNAGSDHDGDQAEFIMAPRIDPTVNEFSPSSKSQINSFVNPLSTANSCVPEVSEAGCTVDGDCNDGNDCTDDTCNSSGQCVNTNNSDACDDGDDCTVGDTCSSGTCQAGTTYNVNGAGCGDCATDADCDDDNDCTDDTCVSNNCVYTDDDSNLCDDGDDCTLGDSCSSGTCQAGTTYNVNGAGCGNCATDADCDDENDCTDDTCVSNNCVYTEDDSNSCSDGDDCTVGDSCSSGTCEAGGFDPSVAGCCNDSGDCTDDGNQCTTTTCVSNQCVTTDNSDSCSDGNPCTKDETCSSGTCQGGVFDYNLSGCNPSCLTPGEGCGGFGGGSCCPGLSCGSCSFWIFGCSCN